MTELITQVNANKYSIRVEVGPVSDRAGFLFKFGHSAEVHVHESYGEARAEVTMGAIGAHSPADARERAASYLKAAEIAELAQQWIDKGHSIELIGQTFVTMGFERAGIDGVREATDDDLTSGEER